MTSQLAPRYRGIGLALAVVLFAREDASRIVALVIAAGPGLMLAGLFHVLPMIANACAWRRLMPDLERPHVRVLAWATWIRESVNGLLPVARIGGEIVAYRIVRRHISHRIDAAASLVADMALSVLSQAGFALLGLALLFVLGHSSTAGTQLLAGVIGVIPLGAGFVLVQLRVGGQAARLTDETVPLADSIAWATPREVPVVVVPGGEHFFHRKLHVLREIVSRWVR